MASKKRCKLEPNRTSRTWSKLCILRQSKTEKKNRSFDINEINQRNIWLLERRQCENKNQKLHQLWKDILINWNNFFDSSETRAREWKSYRKWCLLYFLFILHYLVHLLNFLLLMTLRVAFETEWWTKLLEVGVWNGLKSPKLFNRGFKRSRYLRQRQPNNFIKTFEKALHKLNTYLEYRKELRKDNR